MIVTILNIYSKVKENQILLTKSNSKLEISKTEKTIYNSQQVSSKCKLMEKDQNFLDGSKNPIAERKSPNFVLYFDNLLT